MIQIQKISLRQLDEIERGIFQGDTIWENLVESPYSLTFPPMNQNDSENEICFREWFIWLKKKSGAYQNTQLEGSY